MVSFVDEERTSPSRWIEGENGERRTEVAVEMAKGLVSRLDLNLMAGRTPMTIEKKEQTHEREENAEEEEEGQGVREDIASTRREIIPRAAKVDR